MNSHSRAMCGLAAASATLAATLQLTEHDWLRGAAGVAIAATLAVIATGLPERSVAAKWLSYALLAVVFILLGVRLFGSLA
ncbi:MAG: hypothetical protein ABJB74_07880 [Gemmatimonas sp.]